MHPSRFIRETVTLRNGRRVVLRPIRPSDAPLLVQFHDRLSPDSRYFRFFGPKPVLKPREAEYLASVDFQSRFAIVAVGIDDDKGAIVAVGRFDLVGQDMAEPAIVVRDDYHGVGLGRELLERMIEVARGRGVRRFHGEILADNSKMLELLRTAELSLETDGPIVRVSGPVTPPGHLLRALQIVARYADGVADRTPPLKNPRS